ncbi:MAG: hypothetical protein L6R40_007321 [Gallowayella cf. fulva]|nr:MAG: hypothetical protein L6R40_007321 [Xanthomendoza cf. fulva]
MRVSSIGTMVALLAALVSSQRLTKPALQPNLDNLKQGFINNLKPVASTRTPFQAGYIPSDCKKIAQREGFNPADIQSLNIKYTDCSAPWVFCYHKSSNGPLNDLVDRFSRLPVHTRQFSRHIVSLPASSGHAYNDGGNLVFFGDTLSNINVHIHEAAHSLDLIGAFYPDKPLSSSAKWINEYNQDSAVPDPYAQTNQVENVAQNAVVTTYERNVPGGFFGLNPNANKIFHQYATVDTEQREADPARLLVPGGTCTGRLANSSPVPISGSATVQAAAAPNVALPAGLATIKGAVFNTNDTCHFG